MTALEHQDMASEGYSLPTPFYGSGVRVFHESHAAYAYNGPSRHVKRAIDVGTVLLLLPLLLPLFAIVAALIRMTSPGPIFFKQERVGQDGQLFEMRKFRTMFVDARERLHADPELHRRFIANDHKLALEDDPRIAPFGRFLRKTSIDELPQLINVFFREMSLVGPRPVEATQLSDYGQWTDAYLEMMPGLTGRWQTAGRSDIHFPERAIIDSDYLDSWSIRVDLIILVKTLPCVLRRSGSN